MEDKDEGTLIIVLKEITVSKRERTNHQVDARFQWGRYCVALMSSGKGGTVGTHM